MSDKVRIVHVINSFEFGGAEAMLCNLLLRTDLNRFEPVVVSLIDDLTVAGPILRAGIPIKVIGMKPGVPDPRAVLRLAGYFRKVQPHVVQAWMDHSNLIAGAAARLAPPTRLVWGIHHSNHLPGVAKRSTLFTVSVCAFFSNRWPARIVVVSEHARGIYAAKGFADAKMVVIPNGFDTNHFKPDPEARRGVRAELGLSADTPLVGLLARYDPFKDHTTFIKAASELASRLPSVRFVLCGAGVTPENEELVRQIDSLGLHERTHLLGPRTDIARIHASLDVCVSSSISEAFPLTIGEAMCSGVPCVATDAGDSALIVGQTGRIVPCSDAAALAEGIASVLELSSEARRRLGSAARERIIEHFELGAVTRRYEQLYLGLVGQHGDPLEEQGPGETTAQLAAVEAD
jgi:glycosyltransferase involved in cell wall biosynthesis